MTSSRHCQYKFRTQDSTFIHLSLLLDRFWAFGPIRYARVTVDADTGRSRGTGFVSFWRLEDANSCIEQAERIKSDLDPEVCAVSVT